MAILPLALGFAAAGLVALVLGALLRRSDAADDPRSGPQARSGGGGLLWAGGVLLGVGLILAGYHRVTSGGASAICARAVVCCKASANGQNLEICENLAGKSDDECRASMKGFRQVVEQFRPALVTECE